jgi:hypothetical protein
MGGWIAEYFVGALNATLVNVAGATEWFDGESSTPGRVTFTRTLTDGTPGVLDHQDAHTVTVRRPAYLFEKTVMDVTTGANPATTASPGDRLRYRLRYVEVMVPESLDQFVAHAVIGMQPIFVLLLVIDVDRSGLGAGQLRRLGDDRAQHGLEVERRVDRLADVAERPQLLDRLSQFIGSGAQLVQQAHILDGDDGLAREAPDQVDLLVGERPNLLAVDGDGADQFVLLEHRDKHVRAGAGSLNERNEARIAL